MTTASALAARLAGVRGNELEAVAATVRAYARDKGLIVLPATIDTGGTVELHAEELTVHEVLDAAEACGARVVYLRHSAVVAVAVLAALPAEEARDQAVQAELARIDGWVTDVEVGFAFAGLAHVWATTTSWSDTMADLSGPARRLDDARDDQLTGAELDAKYLSEDEVERWALALTGDSAFRRAVTPADRDAAAEALPGLADALRGHDHWNLSRITGTATRKVRDQAEQHANDLKPQLDTFAAALAADPEYGAITAADARKRYATTWMVDRADGLRLPAWWIADLVGRAKQAPKVPAKAADDQLTLV